LLDVCEKHEVQFVWVQGDAGQPENERCDVLSLAAVHARDLPADTGYEERQARKVEPAVLFE
jgi:ribonuclease HI